MVAITPQLRSVKSFACFSFSLAIGQVSSYRLTTSLESLGWLKRSIGRVQFVLAQGSVKLSWSHELLRGAKYGAAHKRWKGHGYGHRHQKQRAKILRRPGWT